WNETGGLYPPTSPVVRFQTQPASPTSELSEWENSYDRRPSTDREEQPGRSDLHYDLDLRNWNGASSSNGRRHQPGSSAPLQTERINRPRSVEVLDPVSPGDFNMDLVDNLG
ncbi:unnamed protein product, partial [Allacma fusca]